MPKGSNRSKGCSNYIGTKKAKRAMGTKGDKRPTDKRDPSVAVAVCELREPSVAVAV